MPAFPECIYRRMFAQQQILCRLPVVTGLGLQQPVEETLLQSPAFGIVYNAQVTAQHGFLRRFHGHSCFRRCAMASSAM